MQNYPPSNDLKAIIHRGWKLIKNEQDERSIPYKINI